MKIPTYTCRPEGRPTLVRTKLGRGIFTERKVKQESFVPAVVQVAQETHQTRGVLVARRRAKFRILCGKADVIQPFVRKTFCRHGKLFCLALLQVPTQVRIDDMLFLLPEIAQHQTDVVIEHIATGSHIGTATVKIVPRIVRKIRVLGGLKHVSGGVLQREGERPLQTQTLDDLPVHSEKVRQIIIPVLIHQIQSRIVQRIVHVGILTQPSIFRLKQINQIALLIFVFYVWIQHRILTKTPVWRIFCLYPRISQLITEREILVNVLQFQSQA